METHLFRSNVKKKEKEEMARYSGIQKFWIARFRWYITRTKQKVHKIDIIILRAVRLSNSLHADALNMSVVYFS